MKSITADILDYLTNLFIVTDGSGKILKMNEQAESFICLQGRHHPHFIQDLNPALQPPWPSDSAAMTLEIGKAKRLIRIFPVRLADHVEEYLFLFEPPDILRKMDFDMVLDYIDESIIIADEETVMTHVNNMARELSATNYYPGTSLRETISEGVVKRSGTELALKSKKTEVINISFQTGKTLTYTCVPFFDKNGEVTRVISTGRDVTKLIELQESLKRTETLKDHYYNRLSTLESIVGNNTIVHSSDKMKQVVSLSIKAAKSDSPVFVWGESGVGKELVAQLIHKSGNRSEAPFLGINCSAMPSELLEAEFFGYEDGAFTGAKKRGKVGLFEETRDGTLFLDEITELPLTLQSKLLRVFQEKEFMRVGGTKTISANSRIISSTNLTRDQLTDPSRLRRDLYYRLNVIPIYVPPLRERKEDIFPLVRFFLKNMNIKYDTSAKIAPSLMAKFYQYNWPGNVRELKNIIERLVVTTDKREIDVDDYYMVCGLEEAPQPDLINLKHPNLISADGIQLTGIMPLKSALQKVEALLIKRVYSEHQSITKTAEILKIDPSTIHRKIKKGQIRLEEAQA